MTCIEIALTNILNPKSTYCHWYTNDTFYCMLHDLTGAMHTHLILAVCTHEVNRHTCAVQIRSSLLGPIIHTPQQGARRDQISCRWARFRPNYGHQRAVPHPRRNRYFTVINSSSALEVIFNVMRSINPRFTYFYFTYFTSVRTLADRHRLAAYHNKHC